MGEGELRLANGSIKQFSETEINLGALIIGMELHGQCGSR